MGKVDATSMDGRENFYGWIKEWPEEREVKVKNKDGRLWGWSEKKKDGCAEMRGMTVGEGCHGGLWLQWKWGLPRWGLEGGGWSDKKGERPWLGEKDSGLKNGERLWAGLFAKEKRRVNEEVGLVAGCRSWGGASWSEKREWEEKKKREMGTGCSTLGEGWRLQPFTKIFRVFSLCLGFFGVSFFFGAMHSIYRVFLWAKFKISPQLARLFQIGPWFSICAI